MKYLLRTETSQILFPNMIWNLTFYNDETDTIERKTVIEKVK